MSHQFESLGSPLSPPPKISQLGNGKVFSHSSSKNNALVSAHFPAAVSSDKHQRNVSQSQSQPSYRPLPRYVNGPVGSPSHDSDQLKLHAPFEDHFVESVPRQLAFVGSD